MKVFTEEGKFLHSFGRLGQGRLDALLLDFVNDSLAMEYFVTDEYHAQVRVWQTHRTPPQ